MAITFDSIGNGDLAEKFKIALQQVGKNIMNPNMDPDAAREITVNIKFKPVGQGTLNIDYNVKPKLAGFKKAKTVFLVGQDVRTGKQTSPGCSGTGDPTGCIRGCDCRKKRGSGNR